MALQGKRAGVLGYITCSDLANARQTTGKYVISVHQSKTLASMGVAQIVASRVLYMSLVAFRDCVRPAYLVDAHDWLLVGTKGQPMDNRMVNQYIKRAWSCYKKAENVVDAHPLSTRIIRKSLTTHTRECKWLTDAHCRQADRHKDHSTKTAEKVYDHSRVLRRAVVAQSIIWSVWEERKQMEEIHSDDEDESHHAEAGVLQVPPPGTRRPRRRAPVGRLNKRVSTTIQMIPSGPLSPSSKPRKQCSTTIPRLFQSRKDSPLREEMDAIEMVEDTEQEQVSHSPLKKSGNVQLNDYIELL